ncbi:PAS domain-containing sensor histidine kinase [Stigmatella sp. ncwal1]|uniref:histidine kinase n=1 Tax=Stigmatella ashevillensis TaxID=2995309 RepID=A0ABT5DDB4_9BACT|nr:PAS domain-containing sensor histidine kinase [Stigmatella ashevillena]MDC0710327.1 PAS domain-containing sensor histidine kinase [Stigmatella ashevillena]
MRLREIRSPEGALIDFECVDASPGLAREGGARGLPLPGDRLLEASPWGAECGLFETCVRVTECQVPEVRRFSRAAPPGAGRWVARAAPCEGGLTLFLEDLSPRDGATQDSAHGWEILKAIIEDTSDAVFAKNLAGQYILLNPAAARAFGQPPEQILGRTDKELLGGLAGSEAATAVTCQDLAVLTSGQTALFEGADSGPGFGCIWQSSRGVLRGPEGERYGVFGISRDVTVQRRQELQQAQEGRCRERFIGMLGHDLGNPLAAIRLTSAALLARDTLPPETRRGLERIEGSAGRMARMVRQLVDLTRARMGGGIPLRPGEVALDEVCRQVIGELELASPGRSIHLEVRGNCRGFWDPERMAQVLSNLVANALQHSPAGTPIRVRLEGLEVLQRIEVHNVGQPIPEELRPRLFEPFFRAGRGPAPQSGLGLGLGLYIVAQIIQAHGGGVEVSSTLEEGTRFIVLLPRSVPAAGGMVDEGASVEQECGAAAS